ncbi:MAG TPA: hypothetical protein VIT00_08990, partial [Terrimicrobiaceae bacterium]
TGQVCRAQYNKETIVILLYLRSLVRAMGILDGQVVEAQFFLNLAQQLLFRLVQANPDESIFVFDLFAEVRDLHIRHAHALGVGGRIDYSRTLLAVADCWYSRGFGTACLHLGGV